MSVVEAPIEPVVAKETPVTGAETAESAAALLAGLREPAPQAEPTQTEAPEPKARQEEPTPEPEPEVETAGEDDADAEPAEQAAQETESEAAETESAPEGEDDAPTVDAPISWTAAEKEEFAKLPAETRRIVAEREAAREATFQTKTTELSERNRQLDATVEAAQNQSLAQLQQAQALMAQAMQAAGFAEEPNWSELRLTMDPEDVRAIKDNWDDSRRQYEGFQRDFQKTMQGMQGQAEKKRQEFIAAENAKTAERWPEFANEATKGAAVEGLYSYLETEGIPREQSAMLVDANMIAVARKAMAYDALQAAKPQVTKKVKDAPKMAKPGSPKVKTKAEGRRELWQAEMQRAAGSNDFRDYAGAFAALRQRT